jgi:hypothetical protein
MIIANRLTDGLVVFYKDQGEWTVDIADGLVIDDDAEEGRLLELARADEDHCLVIDPNLIEVSVDGESPRPTAIREAIRAFGPTI